MITVFIGYFGVNLVPHGTNDRGGAGAKAPIVGTALIRYFWEELVLLGTNVERELVPDHLLWAPPWYGILMENWRYMALIFWDGYSTEISYLVPTLMSGLVIIHKKRPRKHCDNHVLKDRYRQAFWWYYPSVRSGVCFFNQNALIWYNTFYRVVYFMHYLVALLVWSLLFLSLEVKELIII